VLLLGPSEDSTLVQSETAYTIGGDENREIVTVTESGVYHLAVDVVDGPTETAEWIAEQEYGPARIELTTTNDGLEIQFIQSIA